LTNLEQFFILLFIDTKSFSLIRKFVRSITAFQYTDVRGAIRSLRAPDTLPPFMRNWFVLQVCYELTKNNVWNDRVLFHEEDKTLQEGPLGQRLPGRICIWRLSLVI